MQEETKKVDESTQDDVLEGNEDVHEEEESSEDDEIDYKAELERYKSEKEKLERISKEKTAALREERQRRKELEQEKEESSETLLDEKVKQTAQEILKEYEMKRVQDDIDDLIALSSENADERELIRTIYEKRITHSGYSKKAILQDVEDAKLLANKQKFYSDAQKRVKRGMAQEYALRSSSFPLSSKKEDSGSPRLTSEEVRFLEKMGVKKEIIKQIKK